MCFRIAFHIIIHILCSNRIDENVYGINALWVACHYAVAGRFISFSILIFRSAQDMRTRVMSHDATYMNALGQNYDLVDLVSVSFGAMPTSPLSFASVVIAWNFIWFDTFIDFSWINGQLKNEKYIASTGQIIECDVERECKASMRLLQMFA